MSGLSVLVFIVVATAFARLGLDALDLAKTARTRAGRKVMHVVAGATLSGSTLALVAALVLAVRL